jgi:cystathionine beta-lyase/cystathionine gamma-synthase
MSHKFMSAQQREKLGVTDTLIRISIGLEDAEDLIDDLTNALDSAY